VIGMLVKDKKMKWDTPIKEILPNWHVQDPTVRNATTIVDCLAHLTGLQMNNYWLESNNNIIIPMKDSMKFLNGLIPVKPFRGQFQYNNLGYEVAGHVIEKLFGMTWDQMLRSKIFEPLEMHRTGIYENFCGPENVSKAYGSLSNGTPVQIGDPQIGDDIVAGAAGGVRGSLNDMLKIWLKTGEHKFRTHLTSTTGSPEASQPYIVCPNSHRLSIVPRDLICIRLG
jgi:CubicO group peptidase (beta-lactamase class C family)